MSLRVLPDVTGLDKAFDYSIPDELTQVGVGSIVRVPLHGRRVRGWVVALDPDDRPSPKLRPIAQFSSRGPAPELVELARWASVRWAAGRLRPFLVTAGPPSNVTGVPVGRRTGRRVEPAHTGAAELLASGGGMLRLPPAADAVPVIVAATNYGPALVVVPSVERARMDAIRLRRAGLAVALVPAEWALAAGGVDVVIGARAAVWAPCPELAGSSWSTSTTRHCRRNAPRRGTPVTWPSSVLVAPARRCCSCRPARR